VFFSSNFDLLFGNNAVVRVFPIKNSGFSVFLAALRSQLSMPGQIPGQRKSLTLMRVTTLDHHGHQEFPIARAGVV
jgi:hypothetical protein